jgi:hypothetical protein
VGQAQQQRQHTRRRLVKASLLGIPVIITVRSRPAKAQDAGYEYGYDQGPPPTTP